MQTIRFYNGNRMPLIGLGVYRVQESAPVAYALSQGYRLVDTAAKYGNEAVVGQAIKESGIPRQELFLTTKLWNEEQRTGQIEQSFESSLKALNTDYLDLYLIHWPVAGKSKSTWKVMERLLLQGLVKNIGVCNFNRRHLEEIKKSWEVQPVVNQIECHPYLNQASLIQYCKGEGIQVQAWSPLGSAQNGLLQDEGIHKIAAAHKKSPAQVILRWNIERGVAVIPKSVNEARIKENIAVFDFTLSANEMEIIDALNKDERTGPDPDTFNR